jgi:hypothetical protein
MYCGSDGAILRSAGYILYSIRRGEGRCYFDGDLLLGGVLFSPRNWDTCSICARRTCRSALLVREVLRVRRECSTHSCEARDRESGVFRWALSQAPPRLGRSRQGHRLLTSALPKFSDSGVTCGNALKPTSPDPSSRPRLALGCATCACADARYAIAVAGGGA